MAFFVILEIDSPVLVHFVYAEKSFICFGFLPLRLSYWFLFEVKTSALCCHETNTSLVTVNTERIPIHLNHSYLHFQMFAPPDV